MAKGIMTEYDCAVCPASWCNTVATGRPPKFCGPECARADKTAKQRERRKARREGKPVKAPTPAYWGPSVAPDHSGPTGSVEDFLGVMDGAYLVDGDTSWYRWDAVPDEDRYPGLSAGAYEGRTVWPPLKVIGSNLPWNECA